MESEEGIGVNSVSAPLNNPQESYVATNMTFREGQEVDGENDDSLGDENAFQSG